MQPTHRLLGEGWKFCAAIPVNPRLSAISGPLRDSVFPLKDGSLSIGRELSNDLIIDDSLVSPKHCRVAFEAEHCTVQDLGSSSGTFVNGLPVLERLLDHGDQIVIGGSVFVFLRDEPTIAHPNPIELSDSATNAAATTRLRREDARYLHPEALAALPANERTERDLQTLLKIATAIGSIRNVESLQWQLLGMIFDVVPAERGAILAGSTLKSFRLSWRGTACKVRSSRCMSIAPWRSKCLGSASAFSATMPATRRFRL